MPCLREPTPSDPQTALSYSVPTAGLSSRGRFRSCSTTDTCAKTPARVEFRSSLSVYAPPAHLLLGQVGHTDRTHLEVRNPGHLGKDVFDDGTTHAVEEIRRSVPFFCSVIIDEFMNPVHRGPSWLGASASPPEDLANVGTPRRAVVRLFHRSLRELGHHLPHVGNSDLLGDCATAASKKIGLCHRRQPSSRGSATADALWGCHSSLLALYS